MTVRLCLKQATIKILENNQLIANKKEICQFSENSIV